MARRSGAYVECPYCGEGDEVSVDLGGGESQTYVEDCPVCCRPRVIHVEPSDEPGVPTVWAERDD